MSVITEGVLISKHESCKNANGSEEVHVLLRKRRGRSYKDASLEILGFLGSLTEVIAKRKRRQC